MTSKDDSAKLAAVRGVLDRIFADETGDLQYALEEIDRIVTEDDK